MQKIVVPIVLCGGTGTRLWPLSRAGFPKQFLSLTGRESLFQQTVLRARGLKAIDVEIAKPLVVTGEEHRFLVLDQLREVGLENATVIVEPVGRNTSPALTLAALSIGELHQDSLLLVMPADHHIPNIEAFGQTVQQAIDQAVLGHIVTIGVQAITPEPGFGYIRVKNEEGVAALEVLNFIEKPSLLKAQEYLDQGDYFWNSGIFVLKASVWLKALSKFRPDIFDGSCDAWNQRIEDFQFIRPCKEAFKAIPAESIDFAVMEHAPGAGLSVRMVPLNAEWSDLGAWDAMWDVLPKDESGNVHVGNVLISDSHKNLVYATSRLVCVHGVDDLIVVETPDAVLIVDRNKSQNVKHIVKTLRDQSRGEYIQNRKVLRPWGWYDTLVEGAGFKVKQIMVKPGASLSLQKHHFRAEHWVVVAGIAKIVNGDQNLILSENQSTFIPLGVEHRLTNPGTAPLEIIEVQSGTYLREDDIERIVDDYGR